jgi:pimeloyl-ACP methyl ester carboxylesterase
MRLSLQPAPALPDWLAPSFPFDRHVAEVNGTRIHFVDHGEGRPVLLVHGNPTWSYLWRKVIAQLADYRLVAPDLCGLGLSDKPSRPAAHLLSRHIDWIDQLVAGLDLQDLIVVGQDWGGPIAAGVAARRTASVRGAVFGNTAILKPRRPLRTTPFHRFSHTPILSDAVFRLGGFPQRALSRAQGDRRSIGPEETRAYTWPLRRLRDRAAPLGMARMVPNHEDHPSLAPLEEVDAWVRGFTGPVALVWGLRDPILGRALRRHRAALPDARVWSSDAGHFLQEEVPEDFAEAIRWVDASAG